MQCQRAVLDSPAVSGAAATFPGSRSAVEVVVSKIVPVLWAST
jgi:hypothetical protein